MALTHEAKSELIEKFKTGKDDTGSAKVQVALLTARINELTKHFEKHNKDHSSRRGLLKMVGRRRKLLSYMKKHEEESYKSLLKDLGIRK